MNSFEYYANIIKELAVAKDEAVKRGDYDRAMAIRDHLDKVKLAKRQLPKSPPVELGNSGCTSVICKQCDRAGGVTDMSTNPSGNKPNDWCWSCWKSHQIDELRGEVQALEAWQNVAAESNRDVSAYLKERFPSLDLGGGMPVGNVRKAIEHLETSGMSASEALFGFMGWLTTRDEAVTFSGHHNAGVAADLVSLFCEVNDLAEPRAHWDKNLVHPKERCPDGSEIIRVSDAEVRAAMPEEDCPRLEDQFPSSWRSYLERILSKLSGDLSQDNVAAAKRILKNLLD